MVTTRKSAFCDNKMLSLKTKKSSLYEYSDDFFHCHMIVTDSMSQIGLCDNPLNVVTESCHSMTRTKSSLMIIILWRIFLSLFHIFFVIKCSKNRHKFAVCSDNLGLSLSILVFSDKNSCHLVDLHVSDNLQRLSPSFVLKSYNWSLQIQHCHGIFNNYGRTIQMLVVQAR